MTYAVNDFKAIAARANLRALDGRPQSEDKPVEMPCDVNTDPEGWGMFAGYGLAPVPPFAALDGSFYWLDGDGNVRAIRPTGYLAPEQDGA